MNEPLTESANDPRAQVPLPAQARDAMQRVLQAVLKVVSKQSTLNQEQPVLGEGRDHWPKDPSRPVVLRFHRAQLGDRQLSVEFERRGAVEPWSKATFAISPKNFPRGVYAMDLPASFFADLVFESKSAEERSNEVLEKFNVFRYRADRGGVRLQIDFWARNDVASLDAPYPTSFHKVIVSAQ